MNEFNVKSVHYSLTQRKDPMKPDAPQKFYANAQVWAAVNERELTQMISRRCTLTRTDVVAVLTAMTEVMNEILLTGQSVRLANFGSFHISVQSDGVSNKEDFKSEHITCANIRFLPNRELRDNLRLLQFVQVDAKPKAEA